MFTFFSSLTVNYLKTFFLIIPVSFYRSINGRDAFSTKKFAEKYKLGVPVAGNFYRAQFDDYVPQLYKSLGV